MPLRLLIVPDKFKGTLSAHEAAQAIAHGWRRERPADTLDLLPMSDGGDGFGQVIGALIGAKPQRISTVNAAHRRCTATWWWAAETRTAVVESARVIGLAMLPKGRFHPFELDTFGLGTVLLKTQEWGARHIIVGVGGSATNDGGFGLARALGWRFETREGSEVTKWTELKNLEAVVRPPHNFGCQITVAVDVQNKLLGTRGATQVYGPQKGLLPDELAKAEQRLRALSKRTEGLLRNSHATRPGAGAAGGLGFGLMAFAGATPRPGAELFAELAGLRRRVNSADLVITGEGSLDASTLMGKGVGKVAELCRTKAVPCVALCGSATQTRPLKRFFADISTLVGITTEKSAKRHPTHWLERLASREAREIGRILGPMRG